jgi:hypothetical protein
MSKARRFHSSDLKDIAELAASYSLTVRMEPDGAITLSPPYLDAAAGKRVADSVEEWRRQRNEGKSRGRP